MKKKEKRLILILILLVMIVVGIKIVIGMNGKEDKEEKKNNTVTGGNSKIIENGVKINISKAFNEPKTMGSFEITNIQLTNQNGLCTLLANIKNMGEATSSARTVKVVMLDKDGEEVGQIGGMISPLEHGESTQFNATTTVDYTDVYDFQVIE